MLLPQKNLWAGNIQVTSGNVSVQADWPAECFLFCTRRCWVVKIDRHLEIMVEGIPTDFEAVP